MSDEDMVFLTDGTTFVGPYIVGAFDIPRGTAFLREAHGG